jgi:protein phosphatase
MGGHRAGEVASETAIDALHSHLSAAHPQADIAEILDATNSQVFDAMLAPFGRPGMGTTIAGFWLCAGRAKAFNIGDSRIYLLREGRLKQVSVDHTPDLHSRPNRRSHLLTQSLGGTRFKIPLQPHIADLDLLAGDRILICTDGLSDMVADVRIEAILRENLEQPARALVDAAMGAGGEDNITVVVAEF